MIRQHFFNQLKQRPGYSSPVTRLRSFGESRIFSVILTVALISLISGCRQNSNRIATLPAAPPPTGSAFPSAPQPHGPLVPTFPAVPAILPKPAILGAAYAPVILLPSQMPQPLIRVKITAELPTPPHIRAWLYRGKIKILRLADGKFIALNILPMEDYLAGVLSRELYRSWLPATYRAQAIAARTYALYQIETFGLTHPWDVTGTQSSQVYGGKKAETHVAWQAVQATRGLVMYGESRGLTGIFCAYFSACNGGASQSAKAAWGDHAVSTLRGRLLGDLDANCPEFNWPVKTYTLSQITGAVQHWGQINHLDYLADLGPLATVRITRRDSLTGRPMVITVTDVNGHVGKLRAEEFRLALLFDPDPAVHAPPSSFFDIKSAGQFIQLTHGHGDGHGVGLSQWGAQTLAGRGATARYILNVYYPGNTLHRLW